MEKRHRRGPAVLPHMLVPCLSTESVGNFVCVRSARRSLTPDQQPSERGGAISPAPARRSPDALMWDIVP